jgi:pimeloyl-ACP methyl ester carboxylesterase
MIDLVVLHGANGCAGDVETLAAPLRTLARVHVPNLPGHGGRELPGRLSFEGNNADLLALLDREKIERAVIVGYSLGGYNALHFARHHPERTLGVCAIAARATIDAETLKHWTYLLQPARLTREGNPRAAELLRNHGPHWLEVARANREMFVELNRTPPLGDADLAAIARPVLLVNGNRDQVAPWEETLRMGRLIPGVRLVMYYGLAHPPNRVPMDTIARTLAQWIAETVKP